MASAVNAEGFREILGICEGAKEDKSGWSAFLQHLVDRGLKGVQLIISDTCRGLIESAAEYLPEASALHVRASFMSTHLWMNAARGLNANPTQQTFTPCVPAKSSS